MVLTGPAWGEMYVEGYLGGVQGAEADKQRISGPRDRFGIPGILDISTSWDHRNIPVRPEPAFLGGLKLGAWFDKSGVLAGIDFPNWMKYFGFYLDFSYHRLNLSKQLSDSKFRLGLDFLGINFLNQQAFMNAEFFSEGTAATLGFMFAARYGFLPTPEIPFGRLQPYIAVGPGILFATQQPALVFKGGTVRTSTRILGGPPIPGTVDLDPFSLKPGSDAVATIALAVDAGLRWMVLKNVSFDLFFKYRYARPEFHYSASFFDPITGTTLPVGFDLDPIFHLFSGQVGVAYHF
jgi:hypothetical protein